MNEGWIKLYRKFSDWEWFNISEMVHLFLYLLINANHQEGEWRGVVVKRGQILTGLNSINKATNISFQTIRTCLKRLEKTNEINIQSTNKYSIITICKYEDYQQDQQTTNKQNNKQLTSNQQSTNNKQEYKEEKEYKNIILLSDLSESDLYNKNIEITFKFWNLFKSNLKELGIKNSTIEKAKIESWETPIRLMFESDKRTKEEAIEVYNFLKTEIPVNGFSWKRNILSTEKLRKQFEKLLIAARNGKNKPNNTKSKEFDLSRFEGYSDEKTN